MKREQEHLARFLHTAKDYARKKGFAGTFFIEPKPCEPTKHQYDYDTATVIAFLRQYDLLDDFKLNLEVNHATLAGHTFQHELQVAADNGLLGSIDANRGDYQNGWDTDQFPNNLNELTEAMLIILEAGGFKGGGINFDAKIRRNSTDPEDLFHAHIGSMDVFARSLIIADNILTQSHTIGVLLHEVNSYFVTSVLTGIEKIATQEKYDILIAHSNEDGNREVANTKNLFSKRIEGLIVSQALTSDGTDHFNPYLEHGIPVVFFDRVPDQLPVTKITIDNLNGGFKATEHLILQGYKRIGHITAELTRNVYNDRFKGYKKALKKYRIPFDPSLVKICNLSREESLTALHEIMQERPDALFITNDFVAAVCMEELHNKGISVPGDVGVIGYNNDILGSLVSPKLSTIDYPVILMGETAATELFKKIHNSDRKTATAENNVLIPSELIIRESSLRKNRISKMNH